MNSTSDPAGDLSSQTIREQLIKVLQKEDLDLDLILTLTRKLAEEDQDQIRFSVDAGLINRLGRELVARADTAVSELIKNSYDADATTVTLSFENSSVPGGTLIMDDNGMGMTREQLVNGFMRLSSTEKVENPISPKFQRQRAGRKGIGRFAVQRLGNTLEITTQTPNSANALRVFIDWDRFQPGMDLGTVASQIQNVPKEKDSGTTIIVKGLRDIWTEPILMRIYRTISELIQPYTISPVQQDAPQSESLTEVSKSDDIFKVTIKNIDVLGGVVIDDTTVVLKHALAIIEGHVDSTGQGYWSVTSDILGIKEEFNQVGAEREIHNTPFDVLKNVEFRAYYFIHNSGLIPRSVNKTIFELAQDRGGVRLYRNGYRVHPYGDKGNDWLGLDASAQTRRYLVPHGNINFFGVVQLNDPDGVLFEETASREYLIENTAFEELRKFVYRALTAGVARVGEARGKKITASQKDWQVKRSPSERLHATAEDLRTLASTKNTIETSSNDRTIVASTDQQAIATQLSLKLTQLADEIDTATTEQKTETEELQEEINLLRVLASLGLVIAEFTHEIKFVLNGAILNAEDLADSLTEGSSEKQIAVDLVDNIQRFQSYAAYFYRTAGQVNTRAIVPQNLRIVLNQWHTTVVPGANRIGIEVHTPIFLESELLTCPMHTSEWASILYNFYSNAVKAIIRTGRGKGRIKIVAGAVDDRVYIEFMDDGDGIKPGSEERIFNAFFTTATPADAWASEEDALQGTGLGLKIVKDIAESYEGEVYLEIPAHGFSTSFRFEVPQATEKQKEQYGY